MLIYTINKKLKSNYDNFKSYVLYKFVHILYYGKNINTRKTFFRTLFLRIN